MPTITPHQEGTVTSLTCAYDPGPSPQIPSPPPWLSSSLTPYPISVCWPIYHYYFTAYSSCYDAGRPIAAAIEKSTNRVTINASPGRRASPPPTKTTRQNFHNECTKAETTSRKEGESNELRALIHQQLISCLAYSSCAECHHDESRKEWN